MSTLTTWIESERPVDVVDMAVRLETPENVVLAFQLAGPAIRLAAYLIDLCVRIGIVFVVSMVLACAGVTMFMPGVVGGLVFLVVFLIQWAYYPICEGGWQGRTLGKSIFRLRVIQEQGYPLTWSAALLRNLVRAADSQPGIFYGVGLVSMLVAGNFRRLGDVVAGTIVIEERRQFLPREPLILEKIAPLAGGEIGSWTPDAQVLSLIDEFLGRRNVLTYQRGHLLASLLAETLAVRLNFTGARELVEKYPMAFLARVYVTFHRTREEEA